MRYLYSLVILAVSLSQFVVEARSLMLRPRPALDMTRSQDFVKGVVRDNHPNHSYFKVIEAAVNKAKEITIVVDSETGELNEVELTQAERRELIERSLGIFDILRSANSSTGQYHLSGVIASKVGEMMGWENSAQEGSKYWMDGFIHTDNPRASLPFRTNRGTENLLVYQGAEEVFSDLTRHQAIENKNRELRENCRL